MLFKLSKFEFLYFFNILNKIIKRKEKSIFWRGGYGRGGVFNKTIIPLAAAGNLRAQPLFCSYALLSSNLVPLSDLYFDSFSYPVVSIVFGDMAIVSLFLDYFFYCFFSQSQILSGKLQARCTFARKC